MSDEYDVVVIGTYFFDEIYVGLPQFPELGREIFCDDLIVTPGATYITVAALAKLGVKAGWISCFGTDYYSQYIHNIGQREGLELSLIRHLDRPYRQVTTSLPFQGERAFVTVSDPQPDDMVEYIVRALTSSSFKHLHFAWLPDESYLPAIEAARKNGASVSADCQDVQILNTPSKARQIIEKLDIFLPNARELGALTQLDTLEDGIREICQWANLLIVKDGSNGAWFAHKGQIEHVKALPVEHIVDTTGAGDCFNAGFLFGHVSKHLSVQHSTVYGTICGGYSVKGVGGTSNLLDRESLISIYESYYPNS